MAPRPNRGRIGSALQNLADSFTSGVNYGSAGHVMSVLSELVDRLNVRSFEFDLMSGRVTPESAGAPAVLESVAAYQKLLPQLLQAHGVPTHDVADAVLRLDCGSGYSKRPYVCTMTLRTRDGSLHLGRVERAWPIWR